MAEHKYYDMLIDINKDSVTTKMKTTVEYVSILDGINQGITANSRIGNRIRVSRVEASFDVQPNNNLAMLSLMRLMFVHNTDCASAAPSFSDMFHPGSKDYISLQAPEFMSKYRMKRDYLHSLTTVAFKTDNSATSGPRSNVRFKFPFNKVITYRATGGTAGTTPTNMTKDDLYLAWVATDADCCQIQGTVRVYYTDY